MSLIKLIQGEERKKNGRSFAIAQRDLMHLEARELIDYVSKNRAALHLPDIRRRFPDLAHIPKSRMLFFDIETGGLEFDSPIVCMALAHLSHKKFNVDVECLVARTYAEERAVLDYFLDLLGNYDAFFTYNGRSFDVPRIDSRIIQNGLWRGKSVKEIINGKHHDLYPLVKQKLGAELTDAQLQTVEKLVFNFRRHEDIGSDKIPQTYFEYIYGREAVIRESVASPLLWEKSKERTRQIGYDKPEHEALPIFQAYTREHYTKMGGGFRQEYHPGKLLDIRKSEENMAKIINHNMIDAASMIAVLCYLCGSDDEVPF